MNCKYSRYLDKYLKGNIKKNDKTKLIEHIAECGECSNRLKVIENIDGIIVNALGEPPYESRKPKIIMAAESRKRTVAVHRIIHNSRKFVYAVTAVVIVVAVIITSQSYYHPQQIASDGDEQSQQRKTNETTDNTNDNTANGISNSTVNIKAPEITGAIAKVIKLQKQYSTPEEGKSMEYIVHNGYYYVFTGEKVKKSEVDKLLGIVTRIGVWSFKKEGDTPAYIPSTKYYSIKGVPEEDKIACENGENSKLKAESDYLVLERNEPVESANDSIIFSAKNESQGVNTALKNLQEYIPFLHEFVSDDLELSLVNTVDKSTENKTTGFILMHYLKKDTKNNKIPSYIFVRQYEVDCDPWEGVIRADPRTGKKIITEFDYDPEKKLSSFIINDINWEEYGTIVENTSYFRGTKGSAIFEVSSQELPSDQVKKYLETFSNTITK